MYGFIYNEKHSYNDFGLRIISREMNPPKKKKIKENVPFMNGSYDFSLFNGSQPYEERAITYVMDLKYKNKYEYFSKKVQISNWLMSGIKTKLIDDFAPGYYFLAECEDDLKFNEYGTGVEIEVTFTAYPFMVSEQLEGNDIWDIFNFELDYAQEVKFNVNGSKNVFLYNPGATKITPEVICGTDMNIIKNSITYNLKAGTNKNYMFTLDLGKNDMTVIGTGDIEFKFRKELL